MGFYIFLLVVLGITIIVLSEWFILDSITKQFIYFFLIGASAFVYVWNPSPLPMAFCLTFVIYYTVFYLFRIR